MTIELSVERTSVSEDEFEIVLKDVGDTFDADQHRSLRERGENLYQSLLVIERDPERRILTGDLDALQSCPSGVYVLIDTKPDSKNKRKVFVGMAGSNEEMLHIHRRATDTYLESRGNSHSPTLAQCLEEQNENCPPGMKDWDLAVIIPEDKNTFFLFATLFSIFKKAKGFSAPKALNRRVSYDLFRMHSDAHYFFACFQGSNFFYFLDHYDWVSDIPWYIRTLMIMGSIVMKLWRKIAKSEDEKFIAGQKIEISVKGNNNTVILNQLENSEDKVLTIKVKGKNNRVIPNNYDYLTNVSVKYLNTHFPKQVSSSRHSNNF